MIGQITITAGIDIAAAIYIVGFLSNLLGIPPGCSCPGVWNCKQLGFLCFCDGPHYDPSGADQHFRDPPYRSFERFQCLLAYRWRFHYRRTVDLSWQGPSAVVFPFFPL
jgi:hypothetical protein